MHSLLPFVWILKNAKRFQLKIFRKAHCSHNISHTNWWNSTYESNNSLTSKSVRDCLWRKLLLAWLLMIIFRIASKCTFNIELVPHPVMLSCLVELGLVCREEWWLLLCHLFALKGTAVPHPSAPSWQCVQIEHKQLCMSSSPKIEWEKGFYTIPLCTIRDVDNTRGV